jgi:hypothetical protein
MGGEFAQSKPVFNRARSIGRCFYRQRLRLENRTTAGEAKKQKSRKAPFKAGTGIWKQYRGGGVLEVDFQRPEVRKCNPGSLAKFSSKFGPGYNQRAMEAVRTYRTCNYLAACVMSGAAAESILLALAGAKVGDEVEVLAEYKTSSGRWRVRARILKGIRPGLVGQFDAAAQILHYWRDDAAHGIVTASGEIEAHASLAQLLRLAQIASDHSAEFTST